MLNLKKKDTVIVRGGKDKGKRGEVIKVFKNSNRVLVSKINIIKKHTRPTQQSPGGVMEKEASIHISNLQLICSKCSQPTRIKFDQLDDGEKVRVRKAVSPKIWQEAFANPCLTLMNLVAVLVKSENFVKSTK